uniref:Signal recognition particle subunit SRP68 n=1 Tax=Panagrellus redivivus TaxID=6233 RepID=A0A7E4ZYX6_PANRE
MPANVAQTSKAQVAPLTQVDENEITRLMTKGKIHVALREYQYAYYALKSARKLLHKKYRKTSAECFEVTYFMALCATRCVHDYTSSNYRLGLLQRYLAQLNGDSPALPEHYVRTSGGSRMTKTQSGIPIAERAVQLLEEAYAICMAQKVVEAKWELRKASIFFLLSQVMYGLKMARGTFETLNDVLDIQALYCQETDIRLAPAYAALSAVAPNKDYGVDCFHELVRVLEERRDRVANYVSQEHVPPLEAVRGNQEVHTIYSCLDAICNAMISMVVPDQEKEVVEMLKNLKLLGADA